MSAPRVAVVTVVHGRHDHLRRQQDGLRASARTPDVRCVVAIDDDPTDLLDDDVEVIPCDRTPRGLPLARARNLGAERAIARGADLVIFLDVDCIPGATMIDRYVAAHVGVRRPALLAGPVTYLPPSAHGYPLAGLPDATNPHPARPNPPAGAVLEETNYDLFWSLSFATTPAVWRRIGGFCEEYVGYGAEDTDFATQAARRDVALYWVGVRTPITSTIRCRTLPSNTSATSWPTPRPSTAAGAAGPCLVGSTSSNAAVSSPAPTTKSP